MEGVYADAFRLALLINLSSLCWLIIANTLHFGRLLIRWYKCPLKGILAISFKRQ